MLLICDFASRLACGLSLVAMCTSTKQVSADYFRTLMQIVLGLAVLAVLTGWEDVAHAVLITPVVLSFIGFIAWSLGSTRLSHIVGVLLAFGTICSVVAVAVALSPAGRQSWIMMHAAEGLSSAGLLGFMLGAMLLGHSYLVAPTMSLRPLRRSVLLIFGAVLLRALATAWVVWEILAATGTSDSQATLGAFWSYLVLLRCALGILGPGVVAWLAWAAVQIRSTQSATGILYVGVILVFLGELAGQQLARLPAVLGV